MERVLDELGAEGWQSDRRFAEQYLSVRRERGYGPIFIREELRRRGVDDEILAACLHERAPEWREAARLALARRFRETASLASGERAKRARFLARRGFGADHVRDALDGGE